MNDKCRASEDELANDPPDTINEETRALINAKVNTGLIDQASRILADKELTMMALSGYKITNDDCEEFSMLFNESDTEQQYVMIKMFKTQLMHLMNDINKG